MSKITDLRKYAETKEYKDIVSKCKNKEKNLEVIILQQFPEVDNTPVYSNHDVNYQRMEFNLDILEQIKSKTAWAKIIVDDINDEIERIKKFLTLGIKDQYWMTNSSPVYSKLDMKRWQAQDYRYFQTKIDGMIAALEKEEEEKPSLTSNDIED